MTRKLQIRYPAPDDAQGQAVMRECARGNARLARGMGLERAVPVIYEAHADAWCQAYDRAREGGHVEEQERRLRFRQ